MLITFKYFLIYNIYIQIINIILQIKVREVLIFYLKVFIIVILIIYYLIHHFLRILLFLHAFKSYFLNLHYLNLFKQNYYLMSTLCLFNYYFILILLLIFIHFLINTHLSQYHLRQIIAYHHHCPNLFFMFMFLIFSIIKLKSIICLLPNRLFNTLEHIFLFYYLIIYLIILMDSFLFKSLLNVLVNNLNLE